MNTIIWLKKIKYLLEVIIIISLLKRERNKNSEKSINHISILNTYTLINFELGKLSKNINIISLFTKIFNEMKCIIYIIIYINIIKFYIIFFNLLISSTNSLDDKYSRNKSLYFIFNIKSIFVFSLISCISRILIDLILLYYDNIFPYFSPYIIPFSLKFLQELTLNIFCGIS